MNSSCCLTVLLPENNRAFDALQPTVGFVLDLNGSIFDTKIRGLRSNPNIYIQRMSSVRGSNYSTVVYYVTTLYMTLEVQLHRYSYNQV